MAAAPIFNPNAPIYGGEGVSGATPLAPSPYAALGGPQLTGQRVNVVAPNGETVSIDLAELGAARERGFTVETADRAGIRKYVDENKGLSGAAKVALRGFLDEATFGVGDVLIDANRDPYELAKWQALKADHDVANIAGRVGGFGASLLYGGELFGAASKAGGAAARVLGRGAVDAVEHAAGRAVAAELAYRAPTLAANEAIKVGGGLASKILQSAGDFAAQGAVLSSPKAMAQLITGDPDRAAETWLWGAAGGAALGGIGGAASTLLRRGVQPVAAEALATVGNVPVGGFREKVAGKIRNYADDQVISSLGAIKKYTTQIEKLPGGKHEAASVLAKYDLMPKLGEAGDAFAARVDDTALDPVGKEIGQVFKDATADGGKVSVSEVAQALRERVLAPLLEGPEAVGNESLARRVGGFINSFERKASQTGEMTLEEAHNFRKVIDKRINWKDVSKVDYNGALADVRRELTSIVLERAEQVSGPEAVERLQALNREYRVLAIASDAAHDAAARGLANRRHSLTDYFGNLIGGIVGGAIGGGAGSAIGAYVGGEANNLLRRYAPTYMARGAYGAANMLEGRGLVALEEAFANHNGQLAHIPKALEAMSAGKVAERAPLRDTLGVNVLTRFLEADGAQVDDKKGLMQFADRLASLASDPANMQQRIAEAIADVQDDAPEVAAVAGAKMAQAAQYLDSVAPKPPSLPGPFSPQTAWQPSNAQVKDFKTRVKTALDPYHAIDALMDGSLTRAHVETLQVLAPRLYEEMVRRVMEFGASGKAKPMPYAQRLRLSMLTGAPLDRSIAQLAGYQQTFQSAHATEETRANAAKLQAPTQSDVQRVSA